MIQYSYNIWDKQLQYFWVRKLKTENERQYSNAAAVGGDYLSQIRFHSGMGPDWAVVLVRDDE